MFVKKRIKKRLNFTSCKLQGHNMNIFSYDIYSQITQRSASFKAGFTFSNTTQTKGDVKYHSKSHQAMST